MKTTLSSIFLIIYSFFVYSQVIPDTLLLKENQRLFEKMQEDLRQQLLFQRNAIQKTGNKDTKITTTYSVNWQERGPDNMPSQVNKVIFDLNDPAGKKVWASTFGGLWYNNDITQADTSWHLVSENIGNASIAQDPINPLIIYASSYDNLQKSIDGGITWVNIGSSSFYTSIVVNSNGVVFGFFSNYITYSTDGGSSFTILLNNIDLPDNLTFTDLDFDHENLIYVSLKNGKIYRSSTPTGGTWTNIMTSPLSASSENTRLTISKDASNNKILYVVNVNAQNNSTNTNWIRKSINGGSTWINLSIPTAYGIHMTAYTSNLDIQTSGNPNNFVLAGNGIASSINGGVSWKIDFIFGDFVGGNVQIGTNDRVIIASVMGCRFSQNILSTSPTILSSRNRNLNTTYIIELKVLNKYADSTLFFSPAGRGVSILTVSKIGSGTTFIGSAGIYIDNDERNNNVFSLIQPTISKDDGTAIKQLYSNIYGKVDFDEKNNILYQFRYASQINNETFIRRVRNVGSGKEIIDEIRLAFYLSEVNYIKALNQANTFLIQGDGKLYKIIVSNANVVTTILLNDTDFISNYPRVAMVDRNIENNIYQAGYDGFFRSTDGGITWEEKFYSTGIASSPYTVIITATNNPKKPNQVFVLTNNGIYYTEDVASTIPTWIDIKGNLPNTYFPYRTLNYRETDGMLALGTYGRGIFTTDYFKNTVANEIIFSKYENAYCKNNDVKITFFANGAFSQTNTYRLELSDINGSFASPRLLTTSNDSPIYARIPTDIPSGTGYRFRIVSTNIAVPIISAVSDAITITSGTNLFTANYPQVVNPTDNGFVMNIKTSAAAKTYYVVVANNAAVPSSIQIVAGKNKDGVAGFKADVAETNANEVQNIFVSGLSQGTDYDIYIVSKLPNEDCYSDFVKVDVQTRGIQLNYCTPVNTNACAGNNYISSVSLTNVSDFNLLQTFSTFNSGCNIANFSFSSVYSPTVFTGIEYHIGYKIHDFIGSFPERKIGVWIDYDNDGNFEVVSLSNATNNPSYTYLNIPLTIKPGIKRMRIRVTDNADLNNYSPCLAYNAGETEDYLLNVLTNEPFIYANLDKEQVGQCEVIKVLSNITGTYNEGNLFRVELSDKTGDFTTPRVLLNNLANTLPVNIRLPKDIENGTNYQIRVVSTDPVATSFVSAGFTILPNTQSVSSNYSSGSVLVNHIGTISATNQISGTAKVTYNAWNSVVLLPSFKADLTAGGSFIAQIVGCEN